MAQKELAKKPCKYCKELFKPRGGSQKYCSATCKRKDEQENHKSIKYFTNKPLNTYTCSWCGTSFKNANAKKYCSTSCAACANGSQRSVRKNTTAIELARINQLARDAGLSYGKYVGQEYAKLISHNTKENEK